MIEKMTSLVQVETLDEAVAAWSKVLGAAPPFVDGDRWAQFDVAGGRLSLAGRDRVGAAGVMIKVDDLDAEHGRLQAAGCAPAAIAGGAHERRFTVAMPDGAVAVFYAPDAG